MSIYDHDIAALDGTPNLLGDIAGKTALVVNVASKCGLTPQYEGLQKLHDKYKADGFTVVGFPADDFNHQEPGTDPEIAAFCKEKYSVTFPMFSKISVKGDDAAPLYRYLTKESPFPGEVEWNFQKYLVDRSGNVVARYHHGTKPLASEIVKDVEHYLTKN